MGDHLDLAIAAAREAGEAILSFYRKGLQVELKGDGSPLTLADRKAHEVIAKWLMPTGVALVSEEGTNLHMGASKCWLVDPLDGTKDFLAGNDEFTVNVALVVDGAPSLGVVHAPALGVLYAGGVGRGAWRWEKNTTAPLADGAATRSDACRMAVSRFHDHPDVDVFAIDNGIRHRTAIGSALKYGLLAETAVDVFPRLVGSSEWDTAAGQAVLEAAGGKVLDWHTGLPLRYGKHGRRNPRLLAFRAPYAYVDFLLKKYPEELL